jgi:hypothetical protein
VAQSNLTRFKSFLYVLVDMESDLSEKVDSDDKPPTYDELSKSGLKDLEPPSYQCAVMAGTSA